MANSPVTQQQLEDHLANHGFITNITIEQHLEEADYLTSAALRQWVMGALREEHQALEKRLVDSVRELHDRTAATQGDSDTVSNANSVFDQRQAELTAGFETRDAQLREHAPRGPTLRASTRSSARSPSTLRSSRLRSTRR